MVALQEDESVELKIEEYPKCDSCHEELNSKMWLRRLVGPVHEGFHILQVEKKKLDTWTILRMKNSTAQRILMMLPDTLLS